MTLCGPWTAAVRLPCPSLSPRGCSNSCPLSSWCHPTISSSITPLSSCPQSFLASESFPMSWLFLIRWSKYQSLSFSITHSNEDSGLIPIRIDWFDFFAVEGTLKSSPAPQFESINSLILSLLYGPTLTSIHNYWKMHSFEYIGLCWQTDASAF